jgi:peptidyl-prolyl cis-trans isomerase SurA
MVHAAALDRVVAVVDSSIILESELDQAIAAAKQQIASRTKGAMPPDDVLRSQVLRQLVLKQAQLERVKRYGVTVDEATLNAAVTEIAKQEGASSLAAFQAKLDGAEPGSYALLRQQVADNLSISRLRQQQVSARIKVSEQDIDNFLNSPQGAGTFNNEVHIAHLRVSLPDNPTAAQVQAAQDIAGQLRLALQNSGDVDDIVSKNQNASYKIDGADMGWRKLDELPDNLAMKVNTLANDQITTPIRAADGFHVIKMLERRGNNEKNIVQQFKVRHILIRPSELVSPADAEQKINQLYKRVEGGEDFAVLASTFSDDPGSGSNGGDLDWVTPGMMVPQFDDVMKKTPVGQTSKPFQTQYGWHILKVEDTRQQDMTDQYKRNVARQVLADRQFDQESDNWLREIRAESYVEVKDGTPIN